jgi:hypothetical protein
MNRRVIRECHPADDRTPDCASLLGYFALDVREELLGEGIAHVYGKAQEKAS